jgi:class 3 adenylate cyclase
VIALNIDVRGFSDWSLKVDSAQTALFIKKFYAKLIDGYFTDAAFVKPTGDGLLVVLNFEENEVETAVTKVVEDSLEIVKGFATICKDEPAINYEVPKNVGMGICRGAASRLVSDGLTLDYSGRVLNHASRLMDLARPKGVVLDANLGVDLLPAKLRSRFKRRQIYLKGVSPRTPLSTHFWPRTIEPPAANLSPIGEPIWKHVEVTETRQEMVEDAGYLIDLPNHPPDPANLICRIQHDQVTASGEPSRSYFTTFNYPVHYVDSAGDPQARLMQRGLAGKLEKSGVGPDWPIKIKVSYRIV